MSGDDVTSLNARRFTELSERLSTLSASSAESASAVAMSSRVATSTYMSILTRISSMASLSEFIRASSTGGGAS